mgnify:CR=1 FL=1
MTPAFSKLVTVDLAAPLLRSGTQTAALVGRADGSLEWLKPTAAPIFLFPDTEFPE